MADALSYIGSLQKEQASQYSLWRKAMNSDKLEGNWKEMKGKAQQKWGKLTDDDLDVIDGRREELVGKIQQRYGKSREEAEREVDSF